jgi:cation-transporting ATPase 13A1
MMRKKAE